MFTNGGRVAVVVGAYISVYLMAPQVCDLSAVDCSEWGIIMDI